MVSTLLPQVTPSLSFLALYLGPDLLVPLTSVVGAIVGAILIFWRNVVGMARRAVQLLTRRG